MSDKFKYSLKPSSKTSAFLDEDGEENIVSIEIDRISPFPGNPYRVVDDPDMEELAADIKENGVSVPVLVREQRRGEYQMISGHRRLHAARIAGLSVIPARIRDLSDDEALAALFRENRSRSVLISEQARAVRMTFDAISLAKSSGEIESGAVQTIASKRLAIEQRKLFDYLHLSDLIPELLEMVDAGTIAFSTGAEAGRFEHSVQNVLLEYVQTGHKLTFSKVESLRVQDDLDAQKARDLLFPKEPVQSGINWNFDKEARMRFPKSYSKSQIRQTTSKLLQLAEFFPEEYSEEEVDRLIADFISSLSSKHSDPSGSADKRD